VYVNPSEKEERDIFFLSKILETSLTLSTILF